MPADNVAKLATFVEGHLKIAARKSPIEGDAHLLRWATHLNDEMARLGCADTPRHLVGLTAFDLANARDQLMAATRKAVA